MSHNRKKIAFITLGCPKNLVDSEILMNQIEKSGYDISDTSENAEVAVINTCGFIQTAKQESLETIMHAVRLKQDGRIKKLIVMGCLSERYSAEMKSEIPEVDAFIGANKLPQVLEALNIDLKYQLLGERKITSPGHYEYLKISEGCDRPCTFCAIPQIRGKHQSKPMEDLVREAVYLADHGVKELIVIAQDSTYYGLDLYGKRLLAGLLAGLEKVNGIEWIRLMYAYPAGFPADLIKHYSENSKICRYLDIPLQHISDSVLTSMRRGTSSSDIRKLIENLRASVPGIAIRTTFIVGYPAETDRDFEELLAFVKEVQFERLGVFTYSQEDSTPAFALDDPVPESLKLERYNKLMEAQREISLNKNSSLIGRRIKVIVDRADQTGATGRTEFDAPEVDNEVQISKPNGIAAGDLCEVEITDADSYDLFASQVENDNAKLER